MSPDHRRPVPLSKAYRLLNHGPTVLVSAAHNGQRNIMAAAWAMPLDFEPPKVAVVLDKATWTRHLLEGAGTFVLQVPCVAQADLVFTVGSVSGRELPGQDKFAAFGIAHHAATMIDAPLVAGCIGWLECRLIPEPHLQQAHDLFIGEAVAAWVDERAFEGGKFRPLDDTPPAWRTLHHLGAGNFVVPGAQLKARAQTSG